MRKTLMSNIFKAVLTTVMMIGYVTVLKMIYANSFDKALVLTILLTFVTRVLFVSKAFLTTKRGLVIKQNLEYVILMSKIEQVILTIAFILVLTKEVF